MLSAAVSHDPIQPLLSYSAWPDQVSQVLSYGQKTPEQPTTPTPKEKANSTRLDTQTFQLQSSYPLSSSSSSFSSSPLSSGTEYFENSGPPPRMSVRKRPRIADLKHYQSSPPPRPRVSPTQKRRVPQQRASSADACNRATAWFTSPDRFVSSRSSSSVHCSPVQLGRSVPDLSFKERYTRRKDDNDNPFRSASGARSRVIAQRRLPNAVRRTSPAVYTPSFVSGNNATPQDIEIAIQRSTPRQISAGAVWNVGGPSPAQTAPTSAVPNGRGSLLGSGTNATMHVAHFLDHETPDQNSRRHENRLALALDVDPAARILSNIRPSLRLNQYETPDTSSRRYHWRDNTWISTDQAQVPLEHIPSPDRRVSAIPFRVLDAPRVRDDYYCSILAYSGSCHTLAVAIGNHVYTWTEERGVQNPPLMPSRLNDYVTSVSFSSTGGAHSILAIGRQSGQVSLWSPLEPEVRFQVRHPSPVSCVSFKPTVSHRASTYFPHKVMCEDLLVGDDLGDIYYYSIEWPDPIIQRLEPSWVGTMTVLAKISAHTQQICGLAWSPDNKYFVTGGNDNTAHLFEISTILESSASARGRAFRRPVHQGDPIVTSLATPPSSSNRPTARELVRSWNRFSEEEFRGHSPEPDDLHPRMVPRRDARRLLTPVLLQANPGRRPELLTPPSTPPPLPHRYQGRLDPFSPHEHRSQVDPHILTHPPGLQSQTFVHSAAVKALAFAPWQPSLLATGGGSNDRQIHFFHTGSGAVLALINVFAQVTSLLWSTTKREICATFGYAQPEHKVRIAVFSWPGCDCVVNIPWEPRWPGQETPRALWAIRFPGRPNGQGDGDGLRRRQSREGQTWASRTEEEGCIIVAGSDESIKFHEVWAGDKRGGKGGRGLGNVASVFGGSKILEGVYEGIGVEDAVDREVIR